MKTETQVTITFRSIYMLFMAISCWSKNDKKVLAFLCNIFCPYPRSYKSHHCIFNQKYWMSPCVEILMLHVVNNWWNNSIKILWLAYTRTHNEASIVSELTSNILAFNQPFRWIWVDNWTQYGWLRKVNGSVIFLWFNKSGRCEKFFI